MRSFRPLLPLAALSLAAGCALLTHAYRAPRAPRSEAEKVEFPWGEPKERVTLTGVWLRAVTLAMDDFLPEERAERAKTEGALAACTARRDSYDVQAFVWSPPEAADAGDGADGGVSNLDGGPGSEPGPGPADSGTDAWTQPGMPKAPPVIYVSISLIPDACDFGDSPPVDAGATYVIDTVSWRILAVR
jgi:hypothetical protein